ncbi:MAG: hypothetical protein U0894_08890 [Pirellulales bacterium]
MLAMLILPIGLGWLASARSKSQKAWANVEAIEKAGGVSNAFDRGANPWWQRTLGIDLPRDIEEFAFTVPIGNEQIQVEVLTRLRAFPRLKTLRITDPLRTFNALSPLEHFSELEELDLDGAQGGRKDGKAMDGLPVIAKLPQLKRFRSSNGEEFESANAFLTMTSLEELIYDVRQFDLDLSRLKHLRKLCLRGRITHLILAPHGKIRSRKAFANCERAILQISKLPDLEFLEIVRGDCSDEGLKPLTQLKKLKCVSLESDLITDAGLATLVEMASLETLEVKSIKVTQEAIDQWKAKRPDLTITKK